MHSIKAIFKLVEDWNSKISYGLRARNGGGGGGP